MSDSQIQDFVQVPHFSCKINQVTWIILVPLIFSYNEFCIEKANRFSFIKAKYFTRLPVKRLNIF